MHCGEIALWYPCQFSKIHNGPSKEALKAIMKEPRERNGVPSSKKRCDKPSPAVPPPNSPMKPMSHLTPARTPGSGIRSRS